jgi:hypothetical protein
MKRTTQDRRHQDARRVAAGSTAALILLLHTSAIALAEAPAVTHAQRVMTDALLTAKVKAKLIAIDPDSTGSLRVTTADSVVTLHGAVRTPQDVDRDIAAAAAVRGVRHVRNDLAVNKNLPFHPHR